MKKNSLIERILFALLDKCFVFIFLLIFGSYLFFNHSVLEFNTLFMVCAFAVITLLVLILNYYSKKLFARNIKLRKYMIKNNRKVLFVYFILLLLVQSLVSWQVVIGFNWDAGIIFDTVVSENFQPVFEPYFSYFPNNSMLVFGLRFFYEFLGDLFQVGPELYYKIVMIINIALVDIGFIFGFKIMEKLFNIEKAYQYLLWITLFFGFSPWIMVVYSDTLSIPFTTGALLTLLTIREKNSFGKRMVLSILLAIILFLGYSIRPSTLIVLIASVIIAVLRNVKSVKKLMIYGLLLIITISLFFEMRYTWNYYLYEVQDKMEISEDVAFPWTYWVATGLNEPYGICTAEDQWATIYRDTSDRMYELHKEMIVERLSEKGAGGYIEFLFFKLQWITSEGFFFWEEEGGATVFADYESAGNDIISEIIYYGGEYHDIFHFYYQGFWGLILLLLAFPFKFKNANDNKRMSIALLQTIVVGIVCYILVLEARPRYLIQYIPFFIMLAVVGLNGIEESIEMNLDKNQKRRVRINEES